MGEGKGGVAGTGAVKILALPKGGGTVDQSWTFNTASHVTPLGFEK